jgi:branched-chain amino acid transport system permease protein
MSCAAALRWGLPTVLLLAFCAAAPLLDEYLLYVLTIAALMSILAVSYDVLLGLTGYLSLAHGVLYGVGAYACGLLTARGGWSLWLALPASGVFAALIGAAVGLVAFRTRGLYFAVLTLGIGLVGYQLFLVLEPLTGGVGGFAGIPSPPILPGLSAQGGLNNLVLVLIALWITYLAAFAFFRAPIGAACLAVREDATLAQSLGIRIGVARLAAFTFSAFFAGIAGALFAAVSNFVGPDNFSVMIIGFQVVVLVVVGGMGTLWGPILGALILTALPEALRVASTYSVAAYGLLLLFFVLFAPHGIAGLLRNIWSVSPRRVLRRSPVAAPKP